MPKPRGSDFIDEVHEHAQHNINPYYWFNRVTHFRLAEIRASLSLAWLELLMSIIILLTIGIPLIRSARERGSSFWKELFDFSNASSIQGLLGLIGLLLLSILATLRFAKWLSLKRQKSQVVNELHRDEKKKKHPKRRKDYGRN